MPVELVNPPSNEPAGPLADQWKTALKPRSWADEPLDALFPEGGVIPFARLVVVRHLLLTLGDLRQYDVQEALSEAQGLPAWVRMALVQMASSTDEVARNRDAADIGTLIQLIDRTMQRPAPLV